MSNDAIASIQATVLPDEPKAKTFSALDDEDGQTINGILRRKWNLF